MEPLKQWVCDVCKKIIEAPEKGYVVWRFDDGEDFKNKDFRIIHHAQCDKDSSYTQSLPLSDFVGGKGLANLLSMLDAGPLHRPICKSEVADMREFVEFFRRVQMPFYEEARLYWAQARHDQFFEGGSEVWVYLPDTLETLIRKYKTQTLPV